jgi:hypothetical protein
MADDPAPRAPLSGPTPGASSPEPAPLGRGPLASAIAKAQAGGLLGALRGQAPGQGARAGLHSSQVNSSGLVVPQGPSAGPGSLHSAGGPSGRASEEARAGAQQASTGAGNDVAVAAGTAGPSLAAQPRPKAPDLSAGRSPQGDDILPSSPRRLLRLPFRLRPQFFRLGARGVS